MTAQTFSLQPFPNSDAVPDITITGQLNRTSDNRLAIAYAMCGEIGAIKLASATVPPRRQWELWETTCFEFFIGIPTQTNYWEFNLAPNGNWNAFELTDYRQGIHETTSISQLEIITNIQENQFTLETQLSLKALVSPDSAMEISVTSVIQTESETMTYWATKHSAPEPDFHRRDSFTIQL